MIVLSEHNTTSHLEWIVVAQARHPSVLLVPGNEITTYNGHAGALGTRARYEHRLTLPGTAIADTIAAVHADGALFTIHHPTWAPGDLCIGCAWEHDVDPASIDGVEVAATRWGAAGGLQWEGGLAFWEDLWDRGGRPALLGGSDDHNGGVARARSTRPSAAQPPACTRPT